MYFIVPPLRDGRGSDERGRPGSTTVGKGLNRRPPGYRAPIAQPVAKSHDKRWLILAILGIAQLMVVLDATVVNIALPSAQEALGFSDNARRWIGHAYRLAS